MPIVDTSMYRSREDILAEMLAQLVSAISDAYVGDDGNWHITFEIQAGQLENLYLAHQLLLEDMFVQTASYTALLRHGEQYGVAPEIGTASTGSLQFEGPGATYVGIGTEVAYDPGGGLDPVFFETTADGTIADPGIPGAPTTAINATAGNLNGLYEYMVTFVNASGETLPGAISAGVSPVNQQVNLSAIPVGGTGTTKRRIYRAKNGSGIFRLTLEISDNTTTTITDNITDAANGAGAQVPTVDTSHRLVLAGQASEPGIEGNVIAGAITILSNAPASLTGVVNTTNFTGGSDPEDTEHYRNRILQYLQNPGSGAPGDLKFWAESVDGVETATVFPNTPSNGSVTVRIAGPGGAIPSAAVQANVLAVLQSLDLANITVIVDVFTAQATAVTVDVTPSGTYTLADVTPTVQAAVSNYINALGVGETLKVAGITDAVFGLAGVDDVVVTTPATNQTTGATSKRTPGTITVT